MRAHSTSFVAVGLSVLVLSCSSPTEGSQPDEVSFMLQGQRYVVSQPYVSADIMGTRLSISTDDYVPGKPTIVLEIANYQGALTYELGVGDQGTVVAGGVSYSTVRTGGQGSVEVSREACRTSTVKDPVTGITGPLTYCDLAGTFSFVGLNEAGTSVSITDGAFRVSSAQKR